MLDRFKNLKSLIGNTFNTSRTSGEFLLRETDYGKVHVESDIIRRIVERTRVDGVNEVKNIVVDIPTSNYPLNIKFSLVIRTNYSAPIISAHFRDAIREELENFLDIKTVKIDIRVAQINQQAKDKTKRRVR